jgi:hypothetical protein
MMKLFNSTTNLTGNDVWARVVCYTCDPRLERYVFTTRTRQQPTRERELEESERRHDELKRTVVLGGGLVG